LEWLGFIPDEPSIECFRQRLCSGRQSDRGPIYEAALARLRRAGLVYACDCSRTAIAAAGRHRVEALPDSEPDAGQAPVLNDELRYPGACASNHLIERDGLSLRIRLSRSTEEFDDLWAGPQTQVPADQCGDLLAKDRDGNWTYQFAAAVDDMEQGITLVVRG